MQTTQPTHTLHLHVTPSRKTPGMVNVLAIQDYESAGQAGFSRPGFTDPAQAAAFAKTMWDRARPGERPTAARLLSFMHEGVIYYTASYGKGPGAALSAEQASRLYQAVDPGLTLAELAFETMPGVSYQMH